MSLLLQICLVVLMIAFIGVALALIRTLNRLSKAADELSSTLPSIHRSVDQLERTMGDVREVVARFADIAPALQRTAGLIEGLGQRTADLSHAMLDQIEGPLTGLASLVNGIRAGASALLGGGRRNPRGKQRHKTTISLGVDDHE